MILLMSFKGKNQTKMANLRKPTRFAAMEMKYVNLNVNEIFDHQM